MQAGNLNDAGSALAMELLPGKPDACRELLWWLVRGLGELRCLWSGRWPASMEGAVTCCAGQQVCRVEGPSTPGVPHCCRSSDTPRLSVPRLLHHV